MMSFGDPWNFFMLSPKSANICFTEVVKFLPLVPPISIRSSRLNWNRVCIRSSTSWHLSRKESRREKSAEFVANKNAYGNAIGGLSVGEPHEVMYEMTELVCNILPKDKPRYLMGVGTPANILECIGLGVDMFDCVMPTRNARNGMLFTWNGTMNMRNKKWENDFSPLDENGTSYVDTFYTKAYVRHLFVANEILALQIASIHNLAFYLELVRVAREKIIEGTFATWKNSVINT